MTKIDIFSGFLGAGKTTLIKKLLKEALHDTKVVLIENEFGEIGIDGGFLKESGIEIKEMNSGCICCSLVGDFGTSLKEVLSTYAPERILIEPSGVGKLSDVVKAVDDVAKDMDVQVNSAVAVVDATKCKMYIKNFGEFFCNQIACAGTIILSRTDKVDQAKLNACVEMIREHNDKATIITTPLAQLDGKEVLGTIEGADKLEDMMKEMLEHIHDDHDEDECCGHDHDYEHHHHDHEDGETCSCGHHHHHHHGHDADEVFVSVGVETANRYEQDEVKAMLDKLSDEEEYGTVLRAKGVLQNAAGDWFQFDYVPGESQFRPGTPDYTGRLCVIGAHIDEKALRELFKA